MLSKVAVCEESEGNADCDKGSDFRKILLLEEYGAVCVRLSRDERDITALCVGNFDLC